MRRDVVSPHDTLRLLKQPRADTRSAVRSADYMWQTLRLLKERVHHVHKRSLNATGQARDQANTHRHSHPAEAACSVLCSSLLRCQEFWLLVHFNSCILDDYTF